MKIGYARVSTHEQHLHLQEDALHEAGCERIFKDIVSGTKEERKELKEAINYIREGDVLVVWKLDRLSRSLKSLIQIVSDLNDRGIGLMSIKDNFDTVSSGGKLIFHIFGALAEFERDIIRERTTAGLQAARARGRLGGRPKKLDESKLKQAKLMWEDKEIPIGEICKTLNISKATLYRGLKEVSK